MSNVAVLGMGAMGSRMARALLRAGHDVVVYNRTPERARVLAAEGAEQAATPRAAAAGAAVVIGMVADDRASRAVWLDRHTGAVWGLAAGAIAIESSTLTPTWARDLAGHVGGQGAAFLDAPVVGSRPQADAGQLVYLVGGDDEALARARPVLSAIGGAIRHVGPVGQGMALKLAANALFGIQVAAMGELLGLLRKAGVDEATAVEILGELPVTSAALKGASGQILARSFAPLFPIDLVEKDLGYILETARSVDAPVPTTTAARDVYARARDAGHGDEHIAAVARLFL